MSGHSTRGNPKNKLNIAPHNIIKTGFNAKRISNIKPSIIEPVPHAVEAIGIKSEIIKNLEGGRRRKTHKKRKTHKRRKTYHRRR